MPKGIYTSEKRRGLFKKGHKPLNPIKKGEHRGLKTQFVKGSTENKCAAWKGDKVSYRGLHRWVDSQLGKPRFCENCGNRSLKHRQYHWSNTNGLYKRIVTDWRRLCVKCHKAYDKQMKLNQEKNK